MSSNFLIKSIAESQDAKATDINRVTADIDALITDTLILSIVSTPHTMTLQQFVRGFSYRLSSGGIGTAFTVNVPAIRRGLFWVLNETLFTATIQISGQSLTAPTIGGGVSPNLTGRLLYCDGTDVIAVAAAVTS